MKLLLVSQKLIENSEYKETQEALDINWSKFLKSAGLLSIPIACQLEPADYFKVLDIKGILLTGGNDLSIFSDSDLSKLRDSFEKKLIKEGISRNIPIIGICRGMQLLGKYFNMKLNPIKGHVATEHEISINKKSRFFNHYSSKKIVNSYHQFSLSNTNKSINITAKTNDGNIEAFEHKTLKIAAIMWHPERNQLFDQEDLILIRNFLD